VRLTCDCPPGSGSVQQMRGRGPKYQAIKDIAAVTGMDAKSAVPQVAVKTALELKVQEQLEKRLARREGWISDAEKIPVPEVAKVLVTVRIFVDALVRFPPFCTVTLFTE